MPVYLAELDLDPDDPSRAAALDRALDAACLRLRRAGAVAAHPDGGRSLVGGRGWVRVFQADDATLVRQAAALAQVRVLRLEEVRIRPTAASDSGQGKEGDPATNDEP